MVSIFQKFEEDVNNNSNKGQPAMPLELTHASFPVRNPKQSHSMESEPAWTRRTGGWQGEAYAPNPLVSHLTKEKHQSQRAAIKRLH